jgi:hypothetical protein
MCECRVCELENEYPDDFDEIIDSVFEHMMDVEY